MNEFELPTNIRQIGGVDDRLRIYVEDYAISYLKRFAEAGGDSDRLAFLIGKYMVIDSKGYLFVCGAVQGKFTRRDDGAEVFTDESFEHVNSCLAKYFEGYEVVGWMQSQPGYGTGLNPVCADYHMNNFIKPYQALLVVDPSEKLESFYLWETNMSAMQESKGYFIFYERNRGMQEYILDHKLGPIKGFSRGSAPSESDDKVKTFNEGSKRTASRGRGTAKAPEKRLVSGEYKKVVNMLVSLSAVLFVMAFIMGAGLIQSDGKITELEEELSTLNVAFVYVLSQMSHLSAQVAAAQPVFAPGDPRPPTQLMADIPDPEPVTVVGQTEPTPSPQAQAQATPTPPPATPQAQATPIPPTPPPATPQAQATPIPPPATPSPDQNRTQAESHLPAVALNPDLPQNIQDALAATPTPPPPATPNPITGIIPPRGGLTYEAARRAVINPDEFDLYVVQRGDTLSGIIYLHYGGADMIEMVMEINGITHPDMIFSGRVLLLPRLELVEIEE